ncbi:hypothetical protein C0993_002968 [Termitomyces sp. T159_Od127]|nr:hypothetical protein C0993_002968 [Termitomyces sp. T159_Od127]
MAVLFDLPTDITQLLFCYLDIPEVLKLRQTCKTFRLITQSHVIWKSLLTTLAKQQIPVPRLSDRPLDSLSSTELEHFTRRAWALRQNWVAKSPVARKTLTIKLDPIPYQDGGVPPSFTFIEKTGKRYMLTLTVKGRMREGFVYDLQCWNLEISPPRCIAERKLSHRNIAVNKSADSLASLAILTKTQPVNLLHHFILLPNPSFDMNSPLSLTNFPYNDIPVMKRSIGSPVRLFAKYHMTVGSRGTAIFIDSHTEDYFGRGDVGQRLAGSYDRYVPAVEEGNERPHSQEDSTEVESTMNSSVFGYNEREDWTRVAVDEEEGRIAVGFSDGTIEIREYA